MAAKTETSGPAARTRKPAAAKSGVKDLDAVVKAGTEAASKSYQEAVSKTKAQAEQAVALTRKNVEKTSQTAFKSYDEMASLGKGHFDALVQSNSAVAKGFEAIGKEVLSFAQSTMEENVAQAQALFGAKDIKEVVDLQNAFARGQFDRTVAETAKLTELSVQVANEALQPLQKRVDATVETVLKANAA